MWGHLCMLGHTAGTRLPATVAGGGGDWISCCREGHASPSAKGNCGWDGLSLGHGTVECLWPPSSVKAAPSPLPVPSVPPLLFACTRAHWALPNSAGAQDLSETEWSCVSFLV